MITDCPCGGRYRDEHDHEGRWSRCDRCQTALPAWRAFTDEEIRERVRAYWSQRKGQASCRCARRATSASARSPRAVKDQEKKP